MQDFGQSIDDMVVEWREVTLEPDATDCAAGSCASVALDMSSSGKTQHLDLAVKASELAVEGGPRRSLDVEAVNASARIDDLLGTPAGGMRLLATNATASESRLTSVAFEVKMDDPRRLHGRLRTRGELHRPFELEVNADYSGRDRGFTRSRSAAN